MALIFALAVQGVQMLLVLLAAPLLTGLVRRLKARLNRRRGPPVLQPYRELWRLLAQGSGARRKRELALPRRALCDFRRDLGCGGAGADLRHGAASSRWTADLIAIIAFLGTARFFQALAGMDVGTSFGGIGSSREMMIASLAEPAMMMIVFTLALIAGSTQLSTVAEVMLQGVGLRVSLALALVALVLVAIAENGRIPIDNPATHLELTMVHEAMVLEYSGRHLALIELASSLKLVLYLSLIACVFVPWGMAAAGSGAGPALVGIAAWVVKLGIGGAFLALFETSIAKMRVFRVPDFLGAALMLGLLATLLRFVSAGM